MKYIFLSLFIVSTVLHLIASLKNNKKFRNITKPFILSSLAGFYFFGVEVEQMSWIVIVAILFSLLGDILLIPNGTKWFAIGGVAFMISHAFYVAAYASITNFANIHPILIILFGVLFVLAVAIIFTKLKPHLPKSLFWPMFFYLLVNGTMNCFAIYRLLALPNISSIITALGALLFFISDTSLFFVRFNKNSKQKSHFLVMLTYSIGEFLIILGLI